MSKPLHEMTQAEAMATNDVYALDRLTYGTDFDTALMNTFVEQIDENFSAFQKARLAVRILDRATSQDERTGRLGIEAAMLKVSRAIDWRRGNPRWNGKHGRPFWSLRRRGKHAA